MTLIVGVVGIPTTPPPFKTSSDEPPELPDEQLTATRVATKISAVDRIRLIAKTYFKDSVREIGNLWRAGHCGGYGMIRSCASFEILDLPLVSSRR